MTDIIFRCWDKKSKKYRNINSIVFEKNNFNKGDNSPNLVNLWGEDIIQQKDIIVFRERGEYILEQCTGLKDKNGKLIFVGDIIKYENFLPCNCKNAKKQDVIVPVIFKNLQIETDWFVILSGHHKGIKSKLPLRTYYKHYEVIGNINENKELIEC